MKELLKKLGISLADLSLLLLLPRNTVDSWNRRGTMIPSQYSVYLTALEQYATERTDEALQELEAQWVAQEKEAWEQSKEKTKRKLELVLQKTELQLEKIQQKQSNLLSRGHLAANYLKHLPRELQNNENTKAWTAMIGKKSQFQFRDTFQEAQRLQGKIAALKAELAFL